MTRVRAAVAALVGGAAVALALAGGGGVALGQIVPTTGTTDPPDPTPSTVTTRPPAPTTTRAPRTTTTTTEPETPATSDPRSPSTTRAPATTTTTAETGPTTTLFVIPGEEGPPQGPDTPFTEGDDVAALRDSEFPVLFPALGLLGMLVTLGILGNNLVRVVLADRAARADEAG